MNKILSISVAAYNVSATLRECLDPFLKCEVLDQLDIMIIDDGSKDNTSEIAREYASKYPESIRLIQKENGGWGSTVNVGIENARGKYFRQLDGDDYYKPENMKDYVAFLEKSTADMVIAPYIEFKDGTGEILSQPDCNPGCEIGINFRMADIPSFAPFMHSMTITSRLLKEGLRVTEHCFYTDTEFVLKSCNLANIVSFFDKPIYCYRRASAGQSMSLSGLEKHYKDQSIVIEVLLDYLNNEVHRLEVRKIYERLLLGTCYWQYLVMLYIKPTGKHKKDLIAYDKMLKEKMPEYYKSITLPVIKLLRKTFFLGYTFAAIYKMKKDKRFDAEGRILY